MTPIRFGIQWASALPGAELADLVRTFEDLGYYSIGMPDHYFVGRGPEWVPLHEPFAALGFLAGVTSRIRLVSIVAANDFRHPALFARTAATLDVLSDGRVEAGIGAGWFEPEYESIHIPFDSPSVRVERLEEAITLIKALWTQESTTFEGNHYRVTNAPGLPKPVQEPHPELLIGAGGPKMLQLAGRVADVVGITTRARDLHDRAAMFAEMSPDSVRRKIEMVRSGGRDPIIQIQVDKVEWEGEADHMWQLFGEPSRIIDLVHERAEMGISYFMFRERRVERLREFAEKVLSKL